MLKPIRRIVTGHDAAGRSRVLFEGLVAPGQDMPTDVCLWATEKTPASNAGHADAANRPLKLEPPPTGSAFRFFEIPPGAQMSTLSGEQIEGIMAGLFAQLGASHCRIASPLSPGMHKTRTVDYVVLLAGQLTLLLDEGEVELAPFDVVVQRGTSHAWANRGTQPALLAAVMIDAKPS